MNRLLLAAFAVASALPQLPAQKLAMTDGSDRQVAVFDVGDLLPSNRGLITLPPKAGAVRFAANTPADLQTLVEFVRAFAPELAGAGADLQPLGERHLVALGAPVQVAAVEAWLANARKTAAMDFQVDVRLCVVPTDVFDRDVAARLPVPAGTPPTDARTQVLDAATARALLTALKKAGTVKITQFPQIVAPCLSRAKLLVGKHVTYVRDFEIEIAEAAFGAKPVTDVIFDGHDVDVMVGKTPAGTIALRVDLVDQMLEQPMRELKTTLPGSTLEVTVQVPRVTGCRGSQIVELANGATAVMAARKSDGSWLLTLTTPLEIGPPARAPLLRR